jgi:hypothetical protein
MIKEINMSKKVLHILTILSFLNFGLTTQKTFAQIPSEQEFNLDDLDLDSLNSIEISTQETKVANKENEMGIKEKLTLLTQVLKGMTLKEKTIFISEILKDQIKEHKKACIISASAITAATGLLLTYKYNYKKD